jgi:hypothetical protein
MSRVFERLREMFDDPLLVRTGRTYTDAALGWTISYDSIRADESSMLIELDCVAEQTQCTHDDTGRQQGPHTEM